jgi:hypothetical protein
MGVAGDACRDEPDGRGSSNGGAPVAAGLEVGEPVVGVHWHVGSGVERPGTVVSLSVRVFPTAMGGDRPWSS